MNITSILKILGVKIPPDKLAQIEALLPQIPEKANQIVSSVNHALRTSDQRLTAIEYELRIVQLEQRWQHYALLAILTHLRLEVSSDEYPESIVKFSAR